MTDPQPVTRAVRDAVRERLRQEWRPILDRRNMRTWDPEVEQRLMWEAARHVAPDSSLSLERFCEVDSMCMGHVDWFDKLTLRVTEELIRG